MAAVAANVSAPTSSSSSNQPPTPIAALVTHSAEPPSNHQCDLSCASIEELPNDPSVTGDISAQAHALSTILDSGTTSTLICDRAIFWTYSTQDPVIVKTANHGSLPTSGCGNCVAWLKIGGARHHVQLSNCLHAPGAMLNLLSVGWMLAKGWECNFRGEPARCELIYPSPVALVQEVSAFARTPLTYDIWHARMGHTGAHGQLFQDQIASDRERLARQQELCQARIQGVPPEGVNTVPAAGDEAATNLDPDAIVPDQDEVRYPRILANLIATEFACVTIRSDARRNPLTSDYNMRILPATFDKVMQRSDQDHWLAAMRKEINLMSEMGVYELVKLPEGRRAIGCRWVLEFKEDDKGGSVHKARITLKKIVSVSTVLRLVTPYLGIKPRSYISSFIWKKRKKSYVK
ncbi:uncharacterized protein HD556DRAFT_1305720 [Suillus plorans]|uniref:Retrovirus-related Pol polyprotein from transposon TNT 1-94-like beta-barrel domain-containing protein n=1 Tax=Suillus plorans TaxID=116603 RepID=A0A9P7DN15_9AGAM|nr:uncharacterized protein HD556DRAFT_1305720 [Suillus plorans]KAG1798859.1 hypothetical protein HD556DRAFT_1305720 [Suillus plorans]